MNGLEARLIELNDALLKLSTERAPISKELLKQAQHALSGGSVNTGPGNDTVIINNQEECSDTCPPGGCSIDTHLTSVDYTPTENDCYIGATENGITITLPLGTNGKVYYIKNMTTGNISIAPTAPDTIDSGAPPSVTLGTNNFLMVVYANNRWNIVSQ